MIHTRPVCVLPNKRRFEWLIPLKGAIVAGSKTYASKSAATRAGYRALDRLKQKLCAGDMP